MPVFMMEMCFWRKGENAQAATDGYNSGMGATEGGPGASALALQANYRPRVFTSALDSSFYSFYQFTNCF